MTFKELRALTGYTQQSFGEYLGIPTRTLQSWESGERKPAPYVVGMAEKIIKSTHRFDLWDDLYLSISYEEDKRGIPYWDVYLCKQDYLKKIHMFGVPGPLAGAFSLGIDNADKYENDFY